MAPSSDDSESEEDLVVLGTPLPELAETEVSKKPTTVQDLTAKDKEGRRRFHGAFTGGFSAGYFNTVGSKEGFTPSAFVSSRRQKQDDAQLSRPEDFMDDEDLGEHGIAPRQFATAGNYTSEERKRKLEDMAKSLTQSSALDFGGALNDLVIPEYLPVGIKLLRKMGWRDGQGLGPRMKKKIRKRGSKKSKASEGKKIYGCAMPPPDSDSDDSDSFIPSNMSDLTFAPSDVTPITLSAKDDVKGLGYRGLDPTLALPSSHVNLFGNPVRGNKKMGKGIKGHAFGVGALEDDDDGDIFAQDSLSNYDLTMKEDGDDDGGRGGNFGWTAPRTHEKQKLPVSYVGKLLEGFCLSSKPLQQRKKFPLPKLPSDFKPRHWSRRRKKDDDAVDDDSGGSRRRQDQMTAVDRGLMLGETPIMTSVFDLVGSKDKSRMECAKDAIQMTKSLQASNQQTHEGSADGIKQKDNSSNDKSQQPSKFLSRFTEATTSVNTDNNVGGIVEKSGDAPAKAPLFKSSLTMQPFRKEPSKQARFDQYLNGVQQKVQDPYSQVSNNHRMTEWERSRERDEFSRSAKLYRPMSAMMSARFVQVSMLDDKNQDSKMEAGGDIPDEVKASEMRMFGKLTREDFEWHPDKLVCKRFNVPNPYPGSDIVGLTTVKRDKFSVFNFLSFGDYRPKESDITVNQTEKDVSEKALSKTAESSNHPEKKKKATLSSIFKVLDDPDFHKPPPGNKSEEHLEKQTKHQQQTGNAEHQDDDEDDDDEQSEPDVDLFRAIFKNSDSEDSDEEVEKTGKEEGEDSDDDDRRMSVDESKDDIKKEDDDDEKMYSVIPINFANDMASGNGKETPDLDRHPRDDEELKPPLALLPPSTKSHALGLESSQGIGDVISSLLQEGRGGGGPDSGKPARSWSRWGDADTVAGKSGGKSVFSVLDEINEEEEDARRAHKSKLETGIEDDPSDSEYGPMLPPPAISTQAASSKTETGAGRTLEPDDVVKLKGKDKPQSSHRERHKLKKEKKKKSKHKNKKEKRHKKKSSKKKKASSKSRKSMKSGDSSGSEADSETSSDSDGGRDGNQHNISEKEMLNRFFQVSRMKSNTS